jgi:hypothetical protein
MIDFPLLMVISEKHGEIFVHCPDETTLHAAALKLLATRHRDKWYDAPDRPKAPGFTKQQIDTFPESIRRQAKATFERYELDVRVHLSSIEDLREIAQVIKAKDGARAWKILLNRGDGEYERVATRHYASLEEL